MVEDKNKDIGYIQVFTRNRVCATISSESNNPHTFILITGETMYLEKSGLVNHDCMQRPSQTMFNDVYGTFYIPKNDLKEIFAHASDKILDGCIEDGYFTIYIKDDEILYMTYLDTQIPNVQRGDNIIIQASKPWLIENNLNFF